MKGNFFVKHLKSVYVGFLQINGLYPKCFVLSLATIVDLTTPAVNDPRKSLAWTNMVCAKTLQRGDSVNKSGCYRDVEEFLL
jgi:hypothetical protein